jgi:hypothetical protein
MKRLFLGVLILAGIPPIPSLAQSIPAGLEFQINTETTRAQQSAAVATDLFGNFVVVWESYDQDGDNSGIFAQRFDSAGAPQGAEFQVNTQTLDAQLRPAVAMSALGSFVVVWQSDNQDGDGAGIFGQRFDSAGIRRGSEFRINTYTTGDQVNPRVETDAVGNFVVVWQSAGQDGSGSGVFAQRYDPNGIDIANEFQVNTYTSGDQSYPSIASDPAGNFTVVWQSDLEDGSGFGVFGQRFGNFGTKRGGEFPINTSTANDQVRPGVAVAGPGDFVAVWSSQGGVTESLAGRHFDPNGVATGLEFQVKDFTTSYPHPPSLAADASGNFVVTWSSLGRDGDGYGIAAQQFNRLGLKRGPEFQVNTSTTNNQDAPAVSMDRQGNFVVVWESYLQDGDDEGVFGQRFTCTDVDGDGICDLQDVIVTAPAASATLDCHTPLTGRPTIAWDAGDFDRFRVFVGSDPNFPVGSRISSGDTLLRKSLYTVPTKKWKSACRKAIAANALNPTLFIEVFGVNVDVPKNASNRKTFSQVVQVAVQP